MDEQSKPTDDNALQPLTEKQASSIGQQDPVEAKQLAQAEATVRANDSVRENAKQIQPD